jgi:hypothetical protein
MESELPVCCNPHIVYSPPLTSIDDEASRSRSPRTSLRASRQMTELAKIREHVLTKTKYCIRITLPLIENQTTKLSEEGHHGNKTASELPVATQRSSTHHHRVHRQPRRRLALHAQDSIASPSSSPRQVQSHKSRAYRTRPMTIDPYI